MSDHGEVAVRPANHCGDDANFQFCVARCSVWNSFLNLGIGADSATDTSISTSADDAAIQLWDFCAHTGFSLRVMELAREVITNITVNFVELIWQTDVLFSRLFLSTGINFTMFFSPGSFGSAPFLYLHRLVEAIGIRRGRKRPDPSSEAFRALREAIDQDLALPPSPYEGVGGLNGELAAISNCSLGGPLELGLAGAVSDVEAVATSFYSKQGGSESSQRTYTRRMALLHRCILRYASRVNLVATVLATGSPLFGLLDRIDCRTPVHFWLKEEAKQLFPAGFLMHLLPVRDIESNYVRAYGRFHCDDEVRNALRTRHAANGGRGVVFAEVGAYLGGCSFWAVTHLSGGSRAVAVEQYRPAIETMMKTSAANSLRADVFTAVEACVSDEREPAGKFVFSRQSGVRQPGFREASKSQTAGAKASAEQLASRPRRLCVTLPEVLSPHIQPGGVWDAVRVHTSGFELPILRSGVDMLRGGGVRMLIVNLTRVFPEDERYLLIVELLLSLGAKLSFLGKPVLRPDELRGVKTPAVLVAEFITSTTN
eukprot:TRINITY_DN31050_c0_g1_i1.p1 TRINITY_DN31050_c0_g1~~TRINITY_DN31050_c0_g1_i1.p1  ORF type:complete len:542 (-),score=68.62 TRINITY_DN31050_c0_g1_i1:96-1721(-)